MTRALSCSLGLALLVSCYGPRIEAEVRADGSAVSPVDTFRKPDAGPPDGGPESQCTYPPLGLMRARFEVTTRAIGYRFAPRNIGAIWIEDAAGTFVRSLERWATVRRIYLFEYLDKAGDEAVDVVSGPTLDMHRAHDVTWDLRDTTGCPLPAGSYRVRIELTDGNRAGRTADLAFELGETPSERTFPDLDSFHAMRLVLE